MVTRTRAAASAAELKDVNQPTEPNAALISMLRSWREQDAESEGEQREALLQLMGALDEDRFSDRSIFSGE